MSSRGKPSTGASKTLGPDRVPENQKREVYERVRRALEAKGGVCTQHKVGSSAWDKHEQKVLEEGLRYYPHDKHSNMLIYIRIAASLPKKTVRDVAHHLRYMQDAHRAKMDAAAGMNPAKRHHPDPAAAAAMAAMHEHQMAMLAANAAGSMAAMHTLPGMAPGMSGPGGPGPHLKDEKVEARVCAILQENMALINSIRENMVMGRFFDNHCLMLNFDKNIKEITALLATLPFADTQKLPVQINPYFITGSLPPPMDKRPPHHQHHPPHPLPPGVGPVGAPGHLGTPGPVSGPGPVSRSVHTAPSSVVGIAHGNGSGNGNAVDVGVDKSESTPDSVSASSAISPGAIPPVAHVMSPAGSPWTQRAQPSQPLPANMADEVRSAAVGRTPTKSAAAGPGPTGSAAAGSSPTDSTATGSNVRASTRGATGALPTATQMKTTATNSTVTVEVTKTATESGPTAEDVASVARGSSGGADSATQDQKGEGAREASSNAQPPSASTVTTVQTQAKEAAEVAPSGS